MRRYLLVLALAASQAGHAASPAKIWDASDPRRLAVRLPVRVQSTHDSRIHVFAPDGSSVRQAPLCGPAPAPAALRPWIDPDSTTGIYHGGCGSTWFSRDGRLAVVLDSAVRCGPSPQVRAFDPDSARFGTSRAYTTGTPFWTWALGESLIAAFVEEEKTHVLQSARRLRLEVVGRRSGGLHVERIWEDSSYVRLLGADMDDAGDVAAVIGKRRGVFIEPASDLPALLFVPRGSRPRWRDLEGADGESRVALSPNGRWIAVTVRAGRALRILDTDALRATDPELPVPDSLARGRPRIMRLAIADDRTIAAMAQVVSAPGRSATILVHARPGQVLEEFRDLGPGWIEGELRFFAGGRLFVAHSGRPGLVELGIGGGIESRLAPVDPEAWVFEF